MKKIVSILLVFLYCCLSFAQETYSNPVLIGNGYLKDVCVWQAGIKDYMMFSTHHMGHGSFYHSLDLVNWKRINNIPYDSTVIRRLEVISERSGQIAKCNVWAPQVIRIGDKWNMYFSLSNKGGIIVLQSDNPKGPFEIVNDSCVLIKPSDLNWEYDVIDPFVVKDDSGEWYIFFGSAFGIYRAKLTTDGLRLMPDNKFVHVAGPISPRNEVDGQVHGGMEGVSLYKKNDWWYLFCSKRTDYSIYVGRSRELTGIFLDKEGRLMTDGYSTRIIYPTEEFPWPGHNSEIINDNEGRDFIFYFCYRNKKDDKREKASQIVMSELLWDKEEWPYIEGYKVKKKGNIKPKI